LSTNGATASAATELWCDSIGHGKETTLHLLTTSTSKATAETTSRGAIARRIDARQLPAVEPIAVIRNQ
jgi:hypothetical protein